MGKMVDASDNCSHQPPAGAGEHWQESFFLSWYDARTKSGGYHHVDFQPLRGRACIWCWTAVGGKIAARFQSLNLPLPADADAGAFSIGPISVNTLVPLARYGIEIVHPRAQSGHAVSEQLTFQAFTPPLYLAMDEAGRPMPDAGKVGVSDYHSSGTGHYENIGKVEGIVTDVAGARIPVNGFGMQDHSWGPRQYGGLSSAHRFVHATFGPDLFMSLYAMAKDPGDFSYGYVHDNGRFHRVSELEIDVVVGRDGHTPKSAEIRMWSATGQGYVFSGIADVASVSTHDGGYFGTDAYGEFRYGGRRGSGLIALRERASPSIAEKEYLEKFDTKSRS